MEIYFVIAIAIVLFAISFIMKRRFGLLGLALAAGSILSGIWSYDFGLIPGLFSIPSGPYTSAIVSSIIILLPAALLLFHGYSYKKLPSRIIGASFFAILATAFLIEPINSVLVVNGVGADAYRLFVDNRLTIIGIGLVISVFDLFLTKPVKSSEKHRKH